MLEHLDLLGHEHGSQDRYSARDRHVFWWLMHNCVAHPLIGVAPITPFFRFHDWTSAQINKPNRQQRRAAAAAQRAAGR